MEQTLTIEEQILIYPDLSPDERRAVDGYVKAHPELRPLLDDAVALWRSLQAPDAQGVAVDDEALSFYAATRRLYGDAPPARLRERIDQIEAALNADPALRVRSERLTARAADLDAQSDPFSQFERLTGRSLAPAQTVPASAPPVNAAVPAVRKPPARVYRLVTTVTYSAAAVVMIGAVYTLLFFGSRALQPPAQRLAWFTAEELSTDAYQVTLRGPASAPAPTADAQFLQALTLLDEAQHTTLGLFPRTDEEKLRQAHVLLAGITAHPEAGLFLRSEAAYYLGKTRLALGDVPGAQQALRSTVQLEGARAGEARSLLDQIQPDGPTN